MSRSKFGAGGSPVFKPINMGEPHVAMIPPRRRVPRFAALSLIVVALAAVGVWWYVSPWRWIRQAEAILAHEPAQADALAEAALNNGTNAESRAWLVRCRAQLALRHPLEALGAFSQIKHLEQCDAAAWCALIEESQTAGHTLLADMAMSAALQFRDERARVLTLILPTKASLLPEAEVGLLVQELRGLAGQHPASWRAIGLAEQSRGRLAEAVEAYRQTLALSEVSQPIGVLCRRELAQLLIDLGEFSAAESLVLEVLKASTSVTGDDQVRLAQLRRSSGDRAGAKKILDDLLSHQTEHLPALLLRGTVLTELDQLPAAKAEFTKCLQISPSHAEAHYRLSQLLLRQGEIDLAAKHVREHQRLSDLQQRLLELGRRRTVTPQDPPLMLEMADLLEGLGQPNTAAELRRAAEALPSKR